MQQRTGVVARAKTASGRALFRLQPLCHARLLSRMLCHPLAQKNVLRDERGGEGFRAYKYTPIGERDEPLLVEL